ncbi:MAG: hypothetical protein WCH78_04105 [Bacteroidota bacterium]
MKHTVKSFLLTLLSISIVLMLFSACKSKNELKLVEWQESKMFQLPQQVIDFYYNADTTSNKLFTILDSAYTADELFVKTSTLTETHYSIKINHQQLHIRERDFRAPFLIFNGKLYYSKSLLLKGKLMTPQDLFIFYVDLKTILK